MNESKIFATLFILFLFIGCKTGIPLKTPQADLQEIEGAVLEGKWNEVITYSENRLEREPDNAVIHFVLSMAYYMKGEYELQEEQRSLVLEYEKSSDAVVAWCERLTQQFPNNYYAHLLLGSAYRAKAKVDKAIEGYKRAIEINPNFADAYLGLGATYFANQQIDEAITCFKKAIEINPSHIAAHLNLGLVYEFDDQIDEAIAVYEKTLELNPNLTEIYIYLGNLYVEKGDKDKALKAYKKVIELEPDSELGLDAKDAIKGMNEYLDEDEEDTDIENTPCCR